MMRTVFQVIDTLRIGGAERMAVDVSNELAVRGWDVQLIATRASGELAEQLHGAVRIECLARSSRLDLQGVMRFRQMIREQRPVIMHAHGWSSLQFCAASLPLLRAAPSLLFHDHRASGLPPLAATYRIAAWPFTRAHVAVDRTLLGSSPRTRRGCCQALIPNGLPLDRIGRKQVYGLASPPKLVMLANLRPEKDHLSLIDAVALMNAASVSVDVDLIGSIPDPVFAEELERRIRRRGLTGRITICGPRSNPGLLLHSYDLGVLSSRAESGPIALIEYLAAALPFVATDVGDVPSRLPEELRTWLVRPKDPTALAAKLCRALSAPESERAEIGRAAAGFAETTFSIQRTVDSIETVYGKLILDGAALPSRRSKLDQP